MMLRTARLALLAIAALLAGCDIPHQDAAMQGGVDGVIINYVGDLNETLPLARQHCARYERVPLLRQTKDNYAYYSCVRPGAAVPAKPPGGA